MSDCPGFSHLGFSVDLLCQTVVVIVVGGNVLAGACSAANGYITAHYFVEDGAHRNRVVGHGEAVVANGDHGVYISCFIYDPTIEHIV